MKKTLVFGLLVICLAPPSLVSAKKDKAAAAYERKDFAALTKMANTGDPAAQYNLGVRYADGRGVAQDDAIAVSWYRKAADQGYAGAQFNLGQNMRTGRGVPKDPVKGLALVEKAAENGSAEAKGIVARLDIDQFPYIAFVTCDLSVPELRDSYWGEFTRTTVFDCFGQGSRVGRLNVSGSRFGPGLVSVPQYDLPQVGDIGKNQRLEVKLRDRFSIFAKNDCCDMRLTITIRDRRTDALVYSRSAGDFGTVGFKR